MEPRGTCNRDPAGLSILIVDDDPSCLRSVVELLEIDGHVTVTATRGEEALRVARELGRSRRPLELSILDFNVPDLTGLEIFEHLSVELPELGAIFISGNASKALESRVLAAGGFALVPKPLHVPDLRRVVCAFQSRRAGGFKTGRQTGGFMGFRSFGNGWWNVEGSGTEAE